MSAEQKLDALEERFAKHKVADAVPDAEILNTFAKIATTRKAVDGNDGMVAILDKNNKYFNLAIEILTDKDNDELIRTFGDDGAGVMDLAKALQAYHKRRLLDSALAKATDKDPEIKDGNYSRAFVKST